MLAKSDGGGGPLVESCDAPVTTQVASKNSYNHQPCADKSYQ